MDEYSLSEAGQLLVDLNIVASELDIELPALLVVSIALNCTELVREASLDDAARILDLFARALHVTAP